MASQMFATKGKRPQYNYVDAINAQVPYVPEMYQMREDKRESDRQYKLDEKYLKKQDRLSEQMFEQQEEDARAANIIGTSTLLSDSYFANKAANKLPVGGASASTVPKEGLVKYLAPNQPISELLNPAGLKTGFTTGNLALSGGAGLLAGGLLGKKKKPLKSALYGAGAGAIASYIGSGGDLYKTAVGILGGGAGGGLSSFL
jgi:hypothetical protein